MTRTTFCKHSSCDPFSPSVHTSMHANQNWAHRPFSLVLTTCQPLCVGIVYTTSRGASPAFTLLTHCKFNVVFCCSCCSGQSFLLPSRIVLKECGAISASCIRLRRVAGHFSPRCLCGISQKEPMWWSKWVNFSNP